MKSLKNVTQFLSLFVFVGVLITTPALADCSEVFLDGENALICDVPSEGLDSERADSALDGCRQVKICSKGTPKCYTYKVGGKTYKQCESFGTPVCHFTTICF